MKVRFIKGIASIFGTFGPGEVTDVPVEKIAESWCRNGIAVEVFRCEKHNKFHESGSTIGKKCLQRIEAEKAEAEEARQAEEISIVEETGLVEEVETEPEESEEEVQQKAEEEGDEG